MPDDIARKRSEAKILRAARELEGLGVNVLGFLEQAVDRQKLLGDGRGEQPSAYATRAAAALRDEELEYSDPLFAPGFLWTITDWRRLLSQGDERRELEEELRAALLTVADALARRRTGTHGRPKPRGARLRERDDALLVKVLSAIAAAAEDELERSGARREETAAYYAAKLRRLGFWNVVNEAFHLEGEAPTSRASRAWYAKHRLEHDLFFPTLEQPDRPFLHTVVVAMATALRGGETDPAIFGGTGETDRRVTARSLALRALRQLRPANLEIPRK